MKLRSLFLTFFAALALTSCNDAYEVDPADEITDQNAIRNIEDLQRAMNGVYASISGQSFIEWSAYFTDETRKPSTNRGQGVQVHTWSINSSTTEPTTYYYGLYTTINRVNTVLSKIDAVPAINATEEALKETSKAELLAIRAMAHFDLIRFFAPSYEATSLGVPIVDRVIVFERLPRNTVGEVMTFVKADLATAYATLSTLSNNSNVGKFTPLGIQALRARIAIYLKEYNDAITYSTEVINAVPLAPTPTDYINIWSDAGNAEVVFELKRVTGNTQVGRVFKDANGDIFFNVSNDLFAQFTSTDLRRQIGALLETGSTTDNLKVGKYSGPASNYGLADIKLFRVAEMYLILSEAQALKATPDFAAAELAINTLRASRRLAPTALPNVSFASAADATNKILEERRRELAFEGHRFFDLKRFNRGVDRLASDVLLNPFAEDLAAGDYRFTLPIPQDAIFANDLLIQNPTY